MSPKPRTHVVSLDEFFGYVTEQFTRLDAKLDTMTKDFIVRRELEAVQKDVDRAHEKVREVGDKLRELELLDAADRGENKGRFSLSEKILGIVLTVVTAAAMAYFGLK